MTKDEARDCDHGRMKGKCEVCDLQAELDATNRQVEILSDALAESRREVAALKAVQEPVAHQYQGRNGVWKDFISEKHFKDTLEDGSWPIRALYTTPPAATVQEPPPECQTEAEKRAYAFGWWKALEANRAAPVQEPVAWMQDSIELYVQDRPSAYYTIPLYTTPPAANRPWVGLTDEEKRNICRVGPVYAPDGVVTRRPLEYREELEGVALMAVRKAEAKLKEKNT